MSDKITDKVYLDNAATTPIDPRVLRAMLPYLKSEFGNASSLHQAGLDNRVAVDRAQAKLSYFLNSEKQEVYFTSGATESDNMAILGLFRAIKMKEPNKKWHIITSQIEHDAILEACHQAEIEGAEVTYLPVTAGGLVDIEDVSDAIKENTILVSIMYANNEVGTIQPITEIGNLLHEVNNKRKQKIYFHTDATQALAYCNCNAQRLGVDMMSLSAHKVYGPKGVGAFYLRQGTPFQPLIFGGHQQNNIRPGTYNVAGIVGFGRAVEILSDKDKMTEENNKIKSLRDYLFDEVQKIPDVVLNGDLKKRLPNNANITFKGVEGESVLLMLSEKGIAVSTGSACSSGSLNPSHVLMAMGIIPELAHGSARFTLGRFTQKKDVVTFLKEIPAIINRLRKMSPIKKY